MPITQPFSSIRHTNDKGKVLYQTFSDVWQLRSDVLDRPSHGGNLVWAAAQVDCSPSEILDFSASINPLGPPESAIAVLDHSTPLLTHYPDPNCGNLKSALSEHLQIPPEWILPGNGAAELLTWIGRDLGQLDQCFVMAPGFKDYSRALVAADIPIHPWGVDLSSSTLFSVTHSVPSASGCILNDPHNPTGKRISQEFIRGCLDQFEQVIIDEAFLDFLPPEEQNSAIALLPKAPHLVILRSLTKFYSLPGLRIGYAIAHPQVLKRWQQWRDPWSVNALAIEMGAECVRDTSFQRTVWDWLPAARSHLFERLQTLPYLTPLPSVANFILVACEVSVCQLQQRLLQDHRILIRDCMSFPELGDHYFRVAVLRHDQSDRLITSLHQELSKL